MPRKKSVKAFKSYQEYLQYYAAKPKKNGDDKKSKYYKIGEEIAKMACQKAEEKIEKEKEPLAR